MKCHDKLPEEQTLQEKGIIEEALLDCPFSVKISYQEFISQAGKDS